MRSAAGLCVAVIVLVSTLTHAQESLAAARAAVESWLALPRRPFPTLRVGRAAVDGFGG
jgi:hypothetical protein